MRRLLLLAMLTASLNAQNVYHEASCPSVDRQRMVRMNRQVAVASGLAPAADCHPELRVRYLGVIDPQWNSAPSAPSPSERVSVRGYRRADGTYVAPHTRAAPAKRE